MRIYKPNTDSITLATGTFYADADGIIDIPDGSVTTAVWSQGFRHAKGRIAEIEAQNETPALSEKTVVKAPEAVKAIAADPVKSVSK